MSEMVERVARALQDHADTMSPQSLDRRFVYANRAALARAAIAAMREPTEAMVVAFPECMGRGTWANMACRICSDEIIDGWRAMIDAALAEEQK